MESQDPPAKSDSTPEGFDEAQVELAIAQLRNEQSFPLGLVGGIAGGVAGAALWAILTAFTGYQIGWMAVGVGFLVGIGIRTLGKGMDNVFGFLGAALALLACLLGNLLAACGILSSQEQIPFFQILPMLTPTLIKDLLVATFSPIDLLFYGIAVYEGYKLSFRRISQEELAGRITGARSGTAQ